MVTPGRCAKHRTRNLEIPGSSFGRPGTTVCLGGIVYTTRRTGTIATESKNNKRKRPDEFIREDIPGLSRRLVGRMGVEEDASADAEGRPPAGDADLHRAR